jgi:hypothetical protein
VMVAVVAMAMAAAATAVAWALACVGGGDGAGDGGDGCGAVTAWAAGGGLDSGGGEALAACAAAACRSGDPMRGPRPVASILCERMRSGRCQHVCMRCDPPSSSRRAHLEEEVAGCEQQPAGRRGTCARPAARMQLWKKRHAAHEACGSCGA